MKKLLLKSSLVICSALLFIVPNVYSQTQKGNDIDGENAQDQSGWSVSISSDGNTVAIGAPNNNGGGTYRGHVRVYEWNSGSSSWVQKGGDIDGEADNDYSGFSVSLSSDGSTVAIGAPYNHGGGTYRGHVRVYEWNSGSSSWVQKGGDIDGETDNDNSGSSVSLSGDGNIVVIGAEFNAGGGSNRGHVRVYEWNSGSSSWVQKGGDIDGEADGDQSGFSVSISSDGSTVAIGAPNNNGGGSGRGHVRVYEWNNGSSSWVQKGGDIDGEADGDKSRASVSISSDGSTLAIGAPFNTGGGNTYSDRGHVRVYSWNSGSSSWVQKGGDIDGEADGDNSGWSVSLSSDGNTVAIGAYRNAGGGSARGHVRVYSWNSGSSSWVQKGGDIDGEADGDNSGISVSLSSDGNTVAIGALYNDDAGTNSGHVRVYSWNSGSSSWVQKGGDIDGEADYDQSGVSVSLSNDGNTVAIGAPYNDAGSLNSNRGHVRVYSWNSGSSRWVQKGGDIDGEANADNSGWSVSLSGDSTVAIGAPYNDAGSLNSNRGHVRVYSIPNCFVALVTTEPSDSSVCPGGNALLGYIAIGSIDSFRWESNTGSGWMAVAGSNNDTLTITNATVATQYRGIAFAACGNDTTRTTQLSIHSLPATSLTSSRNPSTNGYAPYQCTNLKANATGNGMLSISWAHGPATDSVQVCPTAGQKYYVTVTDGNGCVKTDSIRQYVVNAATPYAGYSAICYRYPRRNIYYTLSVRETQVPYYLGLGATLGACGSTPSKRGEEASFAGIADLYKFYPNPMSNTLNVEWFNLFTEEVSIDVLDMTGKVVKTLYNAPVVEGELSNLQADMTDLQNGMYLLRFSSNSDYRMNKVQLVK